jgi:hypothetical protein
MSPGLNSDWRQRRQRRPDTIGGALPAWPIHDERSPVCMPFERRGGGADRWGRSIDLPVADPAAAQTRWPEAPMDDG